MNQYLGTAHQQAQVDHPHTSHGASALQLGVEDRLRAQLDSVLAEVWSVAQEQSANSSGNVSLAQLAFRLCALYPEPTPEQAQRIALGASSLELQTSEVCTEHGRVRLTRRELGLLKYLLEHRGSVVTRYELMCEIWQSETGTSPRTVDIHIHRLRAKLGTGSRTGSRPCTAWATSSAIRRSLDARPASDARIARNTSPRSTRRPWLTPSRRAASERHSFGFG